MESKLFQYLEFHRLEILEVYGQTLAFLHQLSKTRHYGVSCMFYLDRVVNLDHEEAVGE